MSFPEFQYSTFHWIPILIAMVKAFYVIEWYKKKCLIDVLMFFSQNFRHIMPYHHVTTKIQYFKRGFHEI